jgi:hypothetical protein
MMKMLVGTSMPSETWPPAHNSLMRILLPHMPVVEFPFTLSRGDLGLFPAVAGAYCNFPRCLDAT